MKNFTKILSIMVIISMILTLSGCSFITKKITSEAKAKISEQLVKDDDDSNDTQAADDEDSEETQEPADTESDDTDEPASITTSDGKGMDWPEKNMGDITPVTCKITAVWSDEKSGSVTFEGMERAEADDYLAEFESMGFTNGLQSEDDDGILYIKTNDAGDSIMFSYAPDGTGLITYAETDAG